MPAPATTKQTRLLDPGQVLKVLATDRGALVDIPTHGRGHWQRAAHHRRGGRRDRGLDS
jgi:TusA-related sulfurtransferase